MDNQFEAILCIVNKGYTDLVMESAKASGARGGTVLSGRGTGNSESQQFFGITVTPEKEIVMIIVPKDIRDEVLSAVNKGAGMDTRGMGIAFSLPISDVIGLPGVKEEA